jgi:hypothetical protein
VYLTTNASNTTYTFNFDFINHEYVRVRLDDKDLAYNVDYTVNDYKQVVLKKNPPSDKVLYIHRETPTDRMLTWQDASVLRAKDLNLVNLQLLHITEEAHDKLIDEGLARNKETRNWNAKDSRISNVADPVDPQDVVTKNYFESNKTGYIQEMNAIKSATQALRNETEQLTDSAGQHENNTRAMKQEVETLKNNASAYANNSQQYSLDSLKYRNETKGYRDEAELMLKNSTAINENSRQLQEAYGTSLVALEKIKDEVEIKRKDVSAKTSTVQDLYAGVISLNNEVTQSKKDVLNKWNEVLAVQTNVESMKNDINDTKGNLERTLSDKTKEITNYVNNASNSASQSEAARNEANIIKDEMLKMKSDFSISLGSYRSEFSSIHGSVVNHYEKTKKAGDKAVEQASASAKAAKESEAKAQEYMKLAKGYSGVDLSDYMTKAEAEEKHAEILKKAGDVDKASREEVIALFDGVIIGGGENPSGEPTVPKGKTATNGDIENLFAANSTRGE